MRVTADQVVGLALAAVLVAALHLLLTRTTMGRAMRAASENPGLLAVIGIDPQVVARWTWLIGGALAAVAGVFVGADRPGPAPARLRPLAPLFAAAILGGIGSVHGAVLGGLVVGLAEALSVPLIGAEYRAAVAFLVLLAVLLVRPTGLLGERP